MEALLALLAALVTGPTPSESGVQSAAPTCQHTDGYIQGPFIPTKAAARRVYLAYRGSLEQRHRTRHRTVVIVADEGDSWSVYESILMRAPDGNLTEMMGGGGLGMTLEKCSGAVRSASLQR